MHRTHAALLALASLPLMQTAGAQSRAGDGILGAAFTVVLDSATIAASPARSLADLLAGRVAGLNVTYPTGAPGFAPEMTARGAATMFGPGRPLLYVDGVLLREDRHLLGPDLDRNRPSHAWSLPTADIAEVEIALGPAAGTLLAFGAPRGAVFVRTKRGRAAGDGRGWRVASSLEATHQPAPDAFRARTFTTGAVTSGGTTDFCPLTDQATGFCTATGTVTRAPFGGRSPFVSSTGLRAALSASGDVRVASLRVGADFDQSPSQLAGQAFERLDLSLAAQSRSWHGLTATLTGRYARIGGTYARFGENGLMPLGLGVIQPNDTTFPYDVRRVDAILAKSRPYHTDRVSAGLDLRWTPRPWVTAYAQGTTERTARGTDLTTEIRNAFTPFEVLGTRREQRSYSEGSGSASLGVRAAHAFARGVRLSGEVGGHLSNVDLQEYAATSTAAVGGGGSLSEQRLFPDIRSRAFFVAARLQFGEHRWIAGGFRKETTELSGAAYGDDPFNTVQANWTISREGFFPRIRGVDRVRLRAAYGESGDHEAVLGTFQFGAFIGSGGPMARRLQRTLEREVGADVDLLRDRVRVRVTAFSRSLRDGYMITNLGSGPPLAFSSWVTHGHEWTIAAPTRTAGPLRWDAAVSWASARTRVTRMGALEVQSTLVGGQRVRFGTGLPFGAVYAAPYTWADANGDLIVDATEITLAVAAPRGVTQPTDLLAITLKAAWRERISAGITLDGKFGHVRTDATERFSCQFLVCPDLYAGSLAAQARAVASGYTATFTGPVHAADFIRAREIWVRAGLPSRLGPLAVQGATLTLAVRNAGRWSRYPGGDPETGSFAFATVQRGDYLTPGLLRQVSLRLDLVP